MNARPREYYARCCASTTIKNVVAMFASARCRNRRRRRPSNIFSLKRSQYCLIAAESPFVYVAAAKKHGPQFVHGLFSGGSTDDLLLASSD
jgi:hypothetical protein